ncbi:DUF1850 domain-containing protein [Azospirillum sp. TSO22-1]|uniref:DUF1850 domain-containing protein n=1 Tax=Azospirillum sp. TSO22-1 TaxID=716789 RepID=UPI000D6062C3|nr:DUF1850 domain-containing protein [Azospirillum sp. TSO22-1]PWC55560.1 hypothetical protein TSO221_04600 [Azospirillum sp. TSO22-1]
MTSLCLALAGAATVLASVPADRFTLSWTHSVERTEWREEWRIADGGLVLETAWVKGGGAGVEPPPDARVEDGWIVWHPAVPPQPRVVLAASPHTADHGLCIAGRCRALHAWTGAADGPIEMRPCP